MKLGRKRGSTKGAQWAVLIPAFYGHSPCCHDSSEIPCAVLRSLALPRSAMASPMPVVLLVSRTALTWSRMGGPQQNTGVGVSFAMHATNALSRTQQQSH
jgi:hypothetical protein